MSFHPAVTARYSALGARFAYVTKGATGKAGERVRFSISGEFARQMSWNDGEYVRLDLDMEAGLGCLVTVQRPGTAVRRITLRTPKSGRMLYEFPRTGEVVTAFPVVNDMSELDVVEVKASDGLVFALPIQATPASDEGGAS
jgi:hypothetical protein